MLIVLCLPTWLCSLRENSHSTSRHSSLVIPLFSRAYSAAVLMRALIALLLSVLIVQIATRKRLEFSLTVHQISVTRYCFVALNLYLVLLIKTLDSFQFSVLSKQID